MIVFSHDQITCKALAVHHSEDKQIAGFKRWTELPFERFAVAHRHQPIPAFAEHIPHRIETLVETGQKANLQSLESSLGQMNQITQVKSKTCGILDAGNSRNFHLAQKGPGKSRIV